MSIFKKLTPDNAPCLSRYVLIDFETTGLSVKDDIVEIGCARIVNGRVESTLQTLVDPCRPIPYYSTKIHGITNADVADAPMMDEILPILLDFIDGNVLVAYNADFDMKFLHKAVEKYAPEYGEIRYLDALAAAKCALPGLSSYKLQYVREYLGIESNNAHRALDDVIITHRVFEICRKRMSR